MGVSLPSVLKPSSFKPSKYRFVMCLRARALRLLPKISIGRSGGHLSAGKAELNL